jgi:hypothetical protein
MSLLDQMDLIAANLLWAQVRRRATEVPREPGDVLAVGALRMRGQIADLHVLEHALPKGDGPHMSPSVSDGLRLSDSARSDDLGLWMPQLHVVAGLHDHAYIGQPIEQVTGKARAFAVGDQCIEAAQLGRVRDGRCEDAFEVTVSEAVRPPE